jgi:hypothetical protein
MDRAVAKKQRARAHSWSRLSDGKHERNDKTLEFAFKRYFRMFAQMDFYAHHTPTP